MKLRMLAPLVAMTVLAFGQAHAATGTTFSLAAATATPSGACDTGDCGITGYDYSGDGSCSAGCAGFPTDPLRTTLTLRAAKFFSNNGCKLRSGTGSFDVSLPSDPMILSAHGTFSFKARDSKFLSLTGAITSSTVSRLYPSEPIKGLVAFPPNPCVGGVGSISLTFFPSA